MSAAPHGSIPSTNRKPSTQTPVSTSPQPSSDLLTNLVAKAQALLAGEMMWPEKKRNLQALTSRGGKGGESQIKVETGTGSFSQSQQSLTNRSLQMDLS